MVKHNWIKDDVVNFPIHKSLQDIIVILEQMDLEEDYGDFDYSQVLDCGAKEYVCQDKITNKQWQVLCLKYDGVIKCK